MSVQDKLLRIINNYTFSLDSELPYAKLLNDIGGARFVLIGEASHGTKEFYQKRIEITQELILHKNFDAVVIEGDWPDVYPIHRYIQGEGEASNDKKALENFQRFPRWMWRNQTMLPFIRWLRKRNDQLSSHNKTAFYGLDLYSLNASMQAVISYLNEVDPEGAARAKQRYACFDNLQLDPQVYGYLVNSGAKESCIKEAIEQLLELQFHTYEAMLQDGLSAEEEHFSAMQNARLIKNAENYYRSMFLDHISSWNLRDQHMFETFNSISDHIEDRIDRPAKIIVWAHNSHVGDARATEMGERGELNIGQLIREQNPTSTYNIGFSTYTGTVTAASDWDAPPQCKNVNPGMKGSYEALFHELDLQNFMLILRGNKELEHYLNLPRLQRAIGVIYRPDTERASHYFFTKLPYQFDTIIHLDQTTAVQPLDVEIEA